MLGPRCSVIIDSGIYYHDNTEKHKKLFVDLDVTGKQAAEEWTSISRMADTSKFNQSCRVTGGIYQRNCTGIKVAEPRPTSTSSTHLPNQLTHWQPLAAEGHCQWQSQMDPSPLGSVHWQSTGPPSES